MRRASPRCAPRPARPAHRLTTSPRDAQGRVTELHAFGARSFSIRDAEGRLVLDSGDSWSRSCRAAARGVQRQQRGERSVDTRSDNKGPEPEGLALGQVAGRTYAFVGLERSAGSRLRLTVPERAAFVDYVNTRDLFGDLADNGSDSGPEGLAFVAAQDSPTGQPLLLVGNEISGTTTVFEVTGR